MNLPILSSVVWSLMRTWGGRLAGFIIYFQLVRMLSVEEMGLFSAAFAIFVFLEIFADQGMLQAVVQRPRISGAQLNAVLLLNMLAGMLLAAGLWLAAPLLEKMIGIAQLAQVLQVGCLTLLFASAGVAQEAWARREFRFRRLATRTLTSTVIGGTVGVWMAVAGHGVWALVAQMLISSAMNTAALWLRPGWHPLVRPDFSGTGELARFGAQVTAMRLIEFGATRGTELLIAVLLGAGALGVYAVGTKIHYIFLQLLGLALSDVAQAGYARLEADAERLRSAYLSTLNAVALASTPVWIVLSAAAPEVIAVAFGPRWTECSLVLTPFALLGALQVLQKFDSAALSATGRPGLASVLSAARAASGLLAVWGAHGYGLPAVALAFTASQILVTPLNLWLLHRCLRVTWRDCMGRIWRPLLAASAAWMAMHLARDHAVVGGLPPYARLLLLATLGGSIYAAVLGAIGRQQLLGLMHGWRALRKAPT